MNIKRPSPLQVTPDGTLPPPLGRDLPESDADRKARRKAKEIPPIDLHATYSMSFHTMYVADARPDARSRRRVRCCREATPTSNR